MIRIANNKGSGIQGDFIKLKGHFSGDVEIHGNEATDIGGTMVNLDDASFAPQDKSIDQGTDDRTSNVDGQRAAVNSPKSSAETMAKLKNTTAVFGTISAGAKATSAIATAVQSVLRLDF